LLYEQSQQAQFLRPTVVTLTYGLGFGMVLVRIGVPALLAMQQDVAKQVTALRRAFRAPAGARRLGAIVAALALVLAALFVGTLGWVIVTGGLPLAAIEAVAPALAARLQEATAGGAMPVALVLFLGAASALLLLVYLVSVLVAIVAARRGKATA